MNYDFWKAWKNKTAVELQAIKVVKLARKRIIASIPKSKLVAIYIKGSFVRREMKKGSDVDIVPIVTENKYETPVFSVNKPEIWPAMVVPLSIWELENNKLCTKGNMPRAKPDRFVKKLSEYKLIYGKPLDATKFKVRTDEEAFEALVKTFKKSFIPLYKKGKISFSQLAKETFWLVDAEQAAKGRKLPHSFKGIASSIKDKTHVIHDAYKYRLKSTKNKVFRKRFVRKLEKYVRSLRTTS